MTRRISIALVYRVILLSLALLFSGNQRLAQSLSLFTNIVPANSIVSYTGAKTSA